MIVVLTKLKSNHNNVRTVTTLGYMFEIPKIGNHFVLYSDPIDKTKDVRTIVSSEIKSMELVKKDSYLIKTRNSLYRLDIKDYEDNQEVTDGNDSN